MWRMTRLLYKSMFQFTVLCMTIEPFAVQIFLKYFLNKIKNITFLLLFSDNKIQQIGVYLIEFE